MQSQSPLFDGVARAMTGALGLAHGLQEEGRAFLRAQADRLVAEMDLVSREEFEAARQLALDARAEAEALRARLAALEAAFAAARPG